MKLVTRALIFVALIAAIFFSIHGFFLVKSDLEEPRNENQAKNALPEIPTKLETLKPAPVIALPKRREIQQKKSNSSKPSPVPVYNPASLSSAAPSSDPPTPAPDAPADPPVSAPTYDPPPIRHMRLNDRPSIAATIPILAGQEVHIVNQFFFWIRVGSDYPIVFQDAQCEDTGTTDIQCDVMPNVPIKFQDLRDPDPNAPPNRIRITALRENPQEN